MQESMPFLFGIEGKSTNCYPWLFSIKKYDVSIGKVQAIWSGVSPRSPGKNNPATNEKNPPHKRYPDSRFVGGIVEIEFDLTLPGRQQDSLKHAIGFYNFCVDTVYFCLPIRVPCISDD
jgi:hypothetical protein